MLLNILLIISVVECGSCNACTSARDRVCIVADIERQFFALIISIALKVAKSKPWN
jgi:hypothetical protein